MILRWRSPHESNRPGQCVIDVYCKTGEDRLEFRGADGVAYDVGTRYVLGAGGGRMMTDWLGIQWRSEREHLTWFQHISGHLF